MIDWTHVEQLAADVGSSEMANIVGLFLDEMDGEVAALASLRGAGNDDLAAKMHFLKGSAYYLGFTTFGNLCSSIETRLRSDDTAEIDLDPLVVVYRQSREKFFAEAPDHSLNVAAA